MASDPYPAGSRSAAPAPGTAQPPGPVVVPHHFGEVPVAPDWKPVIREVAGVVCISLGGVLAGVCVYFLAGLAAAGLLVALMLVALGIFLGRPPVPPV